MNLLRPAGLMNDQEVAAEDEAWGERQRERIQAGLTPQEVADLAKRRSAYHEVGHSIIALVTTGVPPRMVSLRPGTAYLAVCVLGDEIVRAPVGDLDVDAPSFLQKPGLRLYLERKIAVDLAGSVAESLIGHREPSGYEAEDTPDERAALADSVALARLQPRARDLLVDIEALGTATTDLEAALATSYILSGNRDEALAHLMWMRTVVRGLLVAHRDALERLAAALFEATILDTEAFLAVLHESRCVCHSF
jgi:hypothetical protein